MTSIIKEIYSIFVTVALFIVMANVQGAAEHNSRSIDELEWIEGPPPSGVMLALLWGDWSGPGEYGMIVKIKAGSQLPWHAHKDDYRGVTIQGTWVHIENNKKEKVLPPGSFAFQAGNEFHGDRCEGPVDCMIFIYYREGTLSFFVPEK